MIVCSVKRENKEADQGKAENTKRISIMHYHKIDHFASRCHVPLKFTKGLRNEIYACKYALVTSVLNR